MSVIHYPLNPSEANERVKWEYSLVGSLRCKCVNAGKRPRLRARHERAFSEWSCGARRWTETLCGQENNADLLALLDQRGCFQQGGSDHWACLLSSFPHAQHIAGMNLRSSSERAPTSNGFVRCPHLNLFMLTQRRFSPNRAVPLWLVRHVAIFVWMLLNTL